MNTKQWALFLLLCTLVCINAQSKIGLNQVLSHLGNFQAQNGGFKGTDGQPSAEATANALLLSSLYGVSSKINTVEATNFIASLENKDGGYGNTPGAPSDITSVRNALVGLARIGGRPSNPTNVAAYIQSLLDKETSLFAERKSQKGSLRATSLALQSLELLGELEQKWVQDVFPHAKEALKKVATESYFDSETSENYYAISVASYAHYEFPAAKYAQSIASLQAPQGLFYEATSKESYSLQATADALVSLYLLDSIAKPSQSFVDSVNVAAIRTAVRYVPADVVSAANAHLALAVTRFYRDHFIIVSGSGAGVVVEGSEITPTLSVIAKETGGASHGGFSVAAKHTFTGKEAVQGKLTWDQESQSYVGQPLATAGNFGPFDSVYTLSTIVPGLGSLSFDYSDKKHVGYNIAVTPKATIELSGREVGVNEQVTTGTDFQFGVVLASSSSKDLRSGDFIITFSVLDSSDVIVHKSTTSGASQKGEIKFEYKLTAADIPAGRLAFQFDVSSKSGVVHTTHTISYVFGVAMVAHKIQFEGKTTTYKIGDKVSLSFEPATFPDLRTPRPITSTYNGVDVTPSRHFFLDIKTHQGTLLRSVEGAGKSGKYSFEIPVEGTFDGIGVNELTFRYVPAHGTDIILQNYDSTTSELYEDFSVLNYTVKAELTLTDVEEKPSSTELSYGDDIVYRFRVKDAVSGQYVVGAPGSLANVYLELRHEEQGARSYSSVSIPASSVKSHITAKWTINPNAHRGAGTLSLVVQDADGKKIPLNIYNHIRGAVPTKVTIGGEITGKTSYISTSPLDTTAAIFLVELGLYCNNKILKDAQLRANVTYVDNGRETPLAILPVAHHDGRYTVSYSSTHKLAKSGNYKFAFFREVDRALANERREKKQKQEKVEIEESIESGVEPIFTVTVSHTAPRFTSLPVKAEFIALVLFGGIVVWLVNKRSNLK